MLPGQRTDCQVELMRLPRGFDGILRQSVFRRVGRASTLSAAPVRDRTIATKVLREDQLGLHVLVVGEARIGPVCQALDRDDLLGVFQTAGSSGAPSAFDT